MDAPDRLWFSEYRDDKIGMFDTRPRNSPNGHATRWTNPPRHLDKNEDAWTGSMLNDRVVAQPGGDFTVPAAARPASTACSSTAQPAGVWVGGGGASIISSNRLTERIGHGRTPRPRRSSFDRIDGLSLPPIALGRVTLTASSQAGRN
jgi:hypothetical protein